EDINNFEKHLVRNGTLILKFFLHLSKEEQRERFLDRIQNPEKHWKFSADDMAEREHWKDYRKAFEAALTATSTKHAPWHVIPADRKYVSRAAIADIITTSIQGLGLRYPEVGATQMKAIEEARRKLERPSKDEG
ncbi:MAG: polyphosphate kinase 2 family protein, partial [Verrucomicrobiae bacterium]|nr:polyphosphate kinase 2 family protein [Verrucomicrobiae bacterium]